MGDYYFSGMKNRRALHLLLAMICLFALRATVQAQLPAESSSTVDSVRLDTIEDRVDTMEDRVDRLEHKLSDRASEGGLAVLFGAFCALWAQQTRRNPWLWFFLGAIGSVVTVFVLLYKNAKDIEERPPTPEAPSMPPERSSA